MLDLIIETPIPPAFSEAELHSALTQAVQTTLAQQNVTEAVSLSVVIGDNAHIQSLNAQFLGEDHPTDVLSFPADPDALIPEEADYLGDIILSIEKAQQQASERGHAILAELQLLTVHGVLHLLGHDHYTPQEKAEMWQAQSEILRLLGSTVVVGDW
ncbi:MAG TPA: rRNA maturation RNase YbeY [Anaerolineales bacterium]|nr:rRNA maturation RNase YbeY [Anaerolineales bacterium]